MAHSSDIAGVFQAEFRFSPLKAVTGFFQAIVDANRFAREVETVSHFTDAKLARIGTSRGEIVPFVARKTGFFAA